MASVLVCFIEVELMLYAYANVLLQAFSITAKTSKTLSNPWARFPNTQHSQEYIQNGIRYSTKLPVALVALGRMGETLFANSPAQRLPSTKNKKSTWKYLKSRL